MKRLVITEEEKNHILNMHVSSAKKNYLIEDVKTATLKSSPLSDVSYSYENVKIKKEPIYSQFQLTLDKTKKNTVIITPKKYLKPINTSQVKFQISIPGVPSLNLLQINQMAASTGIFLTILNKDFPFGIGTFFNLPGLNRDFTKIYVKYKNSDKWDEGDNIKTTGFGVFKKIDFAHYGYQNPEDVLLKFFVTIFDSKLLPYFDMLKQNNFANANIDVPMSDKFDGSLSRVA